MDLKEAFNTQSVASKEAEKVAREKAKEEAEKKAAKEAKKAQKPKKEVNKKDVLLWVAMSVAIVFWLIAVLRVPYIGTFLDSVFFEFLFGWAKYPLYLLTFVYILCIKVEPLKKIFCVGKRTVWFFAPILMIIILMNIVDCYKQGYNVLIAREMYMGENGYITNWLSQYWDKTVTSFSVSYGENLMPNSYAYGGIIGLIIVFTTCYFSPILVLIIVIFFFVIFALIFWCKKFQGKKAKQIIDNMFNLEDKTPKVISVASKTEEQQKPKQEPKVVSVASKTQEANKPQQQAKPQQTTGTQPQKPTGTQPVNKPQVNTQAKPTGTQPQKPTNPNQPKPNK